MAWFLSVLGLIIGSIVGSIGGALVGAVLGYLMGQFVLRRDRVRDAAFAKASQETGELSGRVRALEAQVVSLQAEVRKLGGAPAPEVRGQEAAQAASPAVTPAAQALSTPAFVETVPTPLSEPELVLAAEPPVAVLPASHAFSDWPDDALDAVAPAPAASPRLPARREMRVPAAPPRTLKERIPARLHPILFGGNTIVKAGVLILFLGLAFLLKYVAGQVTVPIEARYAGVALLAVGMLGLGWRLRDRQGTSGPAGYGLILQGAGVGVFYLTTLAAMKLHPLLPVAAGFAIMVLVTAFSACLAVAQNAPWLAMVAASAGFATPVLVSTGSGNHIALFSYLAILDLGIMAMAWYKAWRPLNLIGFIGTFTLASAWAAKHYGDQVYPSTQGFLLLFFVLFTAIGVLFARRALALGDAPDEGEPLSDRAAQALRQVGRVDSTLVFGVPLTAYGLQYQMVQHDPWWPALAALAFGLFYVLLGGALWRGGGLRYALLGEAYVVVGALFGTLSVPLALEGEWTGATWAVEAAGMYWLGSRQHRTYTRAFAMALMAAASVCVLVTIGWSDDPNRPLLAGSVMGLMLLAGGALAMAAVHRSAFKHGDSLDQPLWEKLGAATAWGVTVLSLALIPWICLMPTAASVLMGLMALACAVLSRRLTLPVLRLASVALHGAALAGFASTLHQVPGQAMLANGPQGMLAALVIALTLLADAWLGLRVTLQALKEGEASRGASSGASPAPVWPTGSSLALCVGLALVGGALLFVMPVGQAALVWPVMGLVLLWLSLKLAHPALALMWAALTGAAALSLLVLGPPVWTPAWLIAPAPDTPLWSALMDGPMGGLAWWTPLVLSICGVLAGHCLQRDARRMEGWRMLWVASRAVQIGIVGWTLVWWWLTCLPEVTRHLHRTDLMAWWPACVALWVTVTAVLMVRLGRSGGWVPMGQAAALALPGWYWAALAAPSFGVVPPSANLGWLAWPLALLCLPWLLRRLGDWWGPAMLRPLHVAGFWLLAWLLCRQAQWATDQWAVHGSGWQALGWVGVPVGLLMAVSSARWGNRWPLREFADTYRAPGALPVVVGLLTWLWMSLFNAGAAGPLPYLPLLNPLEIGQGLVVLALVAWVRSLPASFMARLPDRRVGLAVAGILLWWVLSTVVLRACHHWAEVPWTASDLFNSKLTQAALSVVWALLGVGLMLAGHQRVQRSVWGAGALLLGVVVAKLFFIELADQGGLYRIISFIVVGVLLLLVGYFAPVPPEQSVAGAPKRSGDAT